MAANSFGPFSTVPSGMGYNQADPVRLPYQVPSGGSNASPGMGYAGGFAPQLPGNTLPNGQRYFGADNYGSGANRPPSPFDMAGAGMQRPTGPQQSGGSIGGSIGGGYMGGAHGNPYVSGPALPSAQGMNTIPMKGGGMASFGDNRNYGNQFTGNEFGGPSSGMGYIGSGPGGSFRPAQIPGGLLGVGAQQQPSRAMQAYGSSPVAGMDNRTFQMMARYLPNSGTGVDPVASPGTVRNKYGGDWTKMIPQHLQGKFQQFQNAMGGMTDYNQFRAWQGRPEINYGGHGTRWNPWSGSGASNPAPIATEMQGQMGSMGAAAPAAPGAPAAAGTPVVNALMRNRTNTTPNY